MLLRYDEDERSMHPLTAKSLKGLMITRHRGFGCHDLKQEQVPSSELDSWEVSFSQDDTTAWIDGTDFSQEFKAVGGAITSSNSYEEEEEDFCIFSLEI